MNILILLAVFCFPHCFCDALSKEKNVNESAIINGVPTTIQRHPAMAYLRAMYGPLLEKQCDGTVLTVEFIMTSAECINGSVKVVVRVGATQAGAGVSYLSEKIIVHEGYKQPDYDYDIGLVKLETKIKLSAVTHTVRLPKAGAELRARERLTIVGWGITNELVTIPNYDLKSTEVYVADVKTCAKNYKAAPHPTFVSTTTMFCAANRGTGFCKGDAGGPAINSAGVQVGIISKANGCAQRDYPGVYTKISAVRKWIHDKTNK